MRFIYLIVLTLLMCPDVYAQPSWNIFAGPQMTTADYRVGGVKQNNSWKTGFQAGIGCKIPFENQLSFSPAAFYSLKGYKVNLTTPSFPPDLNAVDNNTWMHTFEIAGLFQFDFNMKPAHLFIKFGLSLDFQLYGHEEYHIQSGDLISQNMKYDYGAYGRYSANFIGQFGYETKSGWMIYGQGSLGLTSINNADHGPKILHRVAGISVGKNIFRKKK